MENKYNYGITMKNNRSKLKINPLLFQEKIK